MSSAVAYCCDGAARSVKRCTFSRSQRTYSAAAWQHSVSLRQPNGGKACVGRPWWATHYISLQLICDNGRTCLFRGVLGPDALALQAGPLGSQPLPILECCLISGRRRGRRSALGLSLVLAPFLGTTALGILRGSNRVETEICSGTAADDASAGTSSDEPARCAMSLVRNLLPRPADLRSICRAHQAHIPQWHAPWSHAKKMRARKLPSQSAWPRTTPLSPSVNQTPMRPPSALAAGWAGESTVVP